MLPLLSTSTLLNNSSVFSLAKFLPLIYLIGIKIYQYFKVSALSIEPEWSASILLNTSIISFSNLGDNLKYDL